MVTTVVQLHSCTPIGSSSVHGSNVKKLSDELLSVNKVGSLEEKYIECFSNVYLSSGYSSNNYYGSSNVLKEATCAIGLQ